MYRMLCTASYTRADSVEDESALTGVYADTVIYSSGWCESPLCLPQERFGLSNKPARPWRPWRGIQRAGVAAPGRPGAGAAPLTRPRGQVSSPEPLHAGNDLMMIKSSPRSPRQRRFLFGTHHMYYPTLTGVLLRAPVINAKINAVPT